MHNYSINSEERTQIPFFLAILSIIFAWVLGSIHFPWWVDAPSVMGFYGILFLVFDRFAWKLKFLHKIGIIKTPILQGEWAGTSTSSTPHPDGNKKVVVKIIQTWTHIKIFLETDTSKSFSFEGSIVINQFEIPMLYYQYESHPKNGSAETMNIHCGSVYAKILNENLIEAEYYSGRGRQNIGNFKITK